MSRIVNNIDYKEEFYQSYSGEVQGRELVSLRLIFPSQLESDADRAFEGDYELKYDDFLELYFIEKTSTNMIEQKVVNPINKEVRQMKEVARQVFATPNKIAEVRVEVARKIWEIAGISADHGNAVMDIIGNEGYENVMNIVKEKKMNKSELITQLQSLLSHALDMERGIDACDEWKKDIQCCKQCIEIIKKCCDDDGYVITK